MLRWTRAAPEKPDEADLVYVDDYGEPTAAPETLDVEQSAAPAPAPAFEPKPINDFLTDKGAAELKRRIEAYWAARGYTLNLRLEDAEFHAAVRSARQDLRSDMLNGMPRKKG